jgi:YD repeat-containing protein
MSTEYIKDRQGKLIGRIDENSSNTSYFDARGRLVAKVIDGKTYEASGRLYGSGDQGAALVREANG